VARRKIMEKQIHYKEVNVGDSLPTLKKHPTPRQLVMWAGASGDFYPIHYDKDFALSQGLPGIIVHGMLTASFLAQLVTDWMGDLGTFKILETSNRSMFFPNQDIICKGKITKKYIEKKENLVECEIWAENSKGEKCVMATALVALPS
jgi:acyl dehydratase